MIEFIMSSQLISVDHDVVVMVEIPTEGDEISECYLRAISYLVIIDQETGEKTPAHRLYLELKQWTAGASDNRFHQVTYFTYNGEERVVVHEKDDKDGIMKNVLREDDKKKHGYYIQKDY